MPLFLGEKLCNLENKLYFYTQNNNNLKLSDNEKL